MKPLDQGFTVGEVLQSAAWKTAGEAGRWPTAVRPHTMNRHLAMYELKEDGRRSVAEIGRLFGDRDHSTVLGAVARITAELTTRAETSADVAAVRASLAAGDGAAGGAAAVG